MYRIKSLYAPQAITFAAPLSDAKNILTALAGFYSRDPIEISSPLGSEWRGEADTQDCHAFIALLEG